MIPTKIEMLEIAGIRRNLRDISSIVDIYFFRVCFGFLGDQMKLRNLLSNQLEIGRRGVEGSDGETTISMLVMPDHIYIRC